MLIITSGMIKTYEECPQKYELIYNHHVEIPSDDTYTEIGKNIHALINYKIKGKKIDKILKSLDKPLNADIKALWNNFLSLNIKNCIESEFTFNVPFDKNTRLTGRIDAIKQTKNGFEILDWKTGQSKNIYVENDWQTVLYLVGLYELYLYCGKISKPDELSMTYCFLKEQKQITVTFSQEKYLKYKQKLQLIIKKLSSKNKENIDFCQKCKNCSMKIVCPRLTM